MALHCTPGREACYAGAVGQTVRQADRAAGELAAPRPAVESVLLDGWPLVSPHVATPQHHKEHQERTKSSNHD